MSVWLGALGSIICGLGNPKTAVFFAQFAESIITDPKKVAAPAIVSLCRYLACFAAIQFTSSYVMQITFSSASYNLSKTIRYILFRHILRMEPGFFDIHENRVNALMSALVVDVERVKDIGGSLIGAFLQPASAIIGAFTVTIATEWKLGLLSIVYSPVLIIQGIFHSRIRYFAKDKERKGIKRYSGYIFESFSSIRTVKAFNMERYLLERFNKDTKLEQRRERKAVILSIVVFSLSRGMVLYFLGFTFWYGSKLVEEKDGTVFALVVAYLSILCATDSVNEIFIRGKEFHKGSQSIRNISRVLDTTPEIDACSADGEVIPEENVEDTILLQDVYFAYPSDPDIGILYGIDVYIPTQKVVGLVGPRGAGKSTILDLIKHFYEPDSGSVKFNGIDITCLNVATYRRYFGVVDQEPKFYPQETVAENVALAVPLTKGIHYNYNKYRSGAIMHDHIINACKMANIHDQIVQLEDGYETTFYETCFNNSELTRLALARALIRNPKILILDGTIWTEEDKPLISALKQIIPRQTTIIAGRNISSLVDMVDWIYMIEQGRIVEAGTHDYLTSAKKKYYTLVNETTNS
ncbi:hypothetical protein TRICI_004135 [Trichomonascus ciferrii]|uniref:ABC transmembrane type-1 domain-containing protein n=1 Tax=Trichomonascus ciferrii TaxID=44093 RepID=A0A642V1M7_9ASCO|nr:hypothetical protein TRICI_004135 [Trichomonascus ciferrii]